MKKYGFETSVGALLMVVVFVLIFVSVIATVGNVTQNATNQSQQGANVTGATWSLTLLMPLLFVAVGLSKIVGFV